MSDFENPAHLEPENQEPEHGSVSYGTRDDMVAFKVDSTGMMVPERTDEQFDSCSLTSIVTIDSQVNVVKLKAHTTIQTTCQHCGENVSTTVFHRKTPFTYICSVLLLPICCCFIPHVVKKFQRPIHICPICNQRVSEFSTRPVCCAK